MEDPATSTPPDVPARIRDQIQGRQKRKRDEPEKVRERNLKRRKTSSLQCGRLAFYYQEEKEKIQLLNKLDTVKYHLGEGKLDGKVSTFKTLNRVLDFFIERHHLSDPTSSGHSTLQTDPSDGDAAEAQKPPQFLHLPVQSAQTEDIFLSTPTAVSNLVQRVRIHSQTCGEPLFQTASKRLRHALHATFSCKAKHSLQWTSS